MTSRDFCFWLQGYAEIDGTAPTPDQWTRIRNHLALVFKHEIDPSMPDGTGELQATHDGEPAQAPAARPPFNRPPGMRC